MYVIRQVSLICLIQLEISRTGRCNPKIKHTVGSLRQAQQRRERNSRRALSICCCQPQTSGATEHCRSCRTADVPQPISPQLICQNRWDRARSLLHSRERPSSSCTRAVHRSGQPIARPVFCFAGDRPCPRRPCCHKGHVRPRSLFGARTDRRAGACCHMSFKASLRRKTRGYGPGPKCTYCASP